MEKEVVEALAALLSDKDWRVQTATAEALGKIGDARAVGPLAARPVDRDSKVRAAGAGALGEVGSRPQVGH